MDTPFHGPVLVRGTPGLQQQELVSCTCAHNKWLEHEKRWRPLNSPLLEGEQRSFALTYARAEEPPPHRINVQKALKDTEQFWKRWCNVNTYEGPWSDAVERSLITLKALTYRPTGGIVAAPTTLFQRVSAAIATGTIAIAGFGTQASRSSRSSPQVIAMKLAPGSSGSSRRSEAMYAACRSCMECAESDIFLSARSLGYADIGDRSPSERVMRLLSKCNSTYLERWPMPS